MPQLSHDKLAIYMMRFRFGIEGGAFRNRHHAMRPSLRRRYSNKRTTPFPPQTLSLTSQFAESISFIQAAEPTIGAFRGLAMMSAGRCSLVTGNPVAGMAIEIFLGREVIRRDVPNDPGGRKKAHRKRKKPA
jgi:hypothetical protein